MDSPEHKNWGPLNSRALPAPDRDPGLVFERGRGACVPVLSGVAGPVDREFARIAWRATRPEWTQAGWWDTTLREHVRELLWLPVGLELQQRLMSLSAADRATGYQPGECPLPHPAPTITERIGVPGQPCPCQIVCVAAWAAVASWVGLRAEQEVVNVAGPDTVEGYLVPERPGLGTIIDPAVEELAPALRVSPGSARHRLAGLRRIAALPRLHEAIESGSMIGWHAHMLATDLRHLPDSDQSDVIDRLLDRVRARRVHGLREWTLTDLRAQAKRIAAHLDLDLAARRQHCHDRRGVRLRLHGHGSATVSADLADDVATRIFNRITAIAHGLDPNSDADVGARTLEQRRADVFTDLLLSSPAGLDGPSGDDALSTAATVAGSEVALVIDLATLLRLANDPGEVPGCGPVPAEIARQLAADCGWRAWITQTTAAGTQVVATSPGRYRPSAALARLIRAREPECRMPGCRSRTTDLDHVIPFPHGQTSPDNLGPLCRRHHRLKTHTRWRQRADSDDESVSWTWTSPAGLTHDDRPEPPLA